MQCASQQLGEGFASHLVSSPANFQAKLGEHLSLAGLDWTPCNASSSSRLIGCRRGQAKQNGEPDKLCWLARRATTEGRRFAHG